jgi:hypothetical protein
MRWENQGDNVLTTEEGGWTGSVYSTGATWSASIQKFPARPVYCEATFPNLAEATRWCEDRIKPHIPSATFIPNSRSRVPFVSRFTSETRPFKSKKTKYKVTPAIQPVRPALPNAPKSVDQMAGFTTCPHCKVAIKQTRLARHIAERCPNRQTSSTKTIQQPSTAPIHTKNRKSSSISARAISFVKDHSAEELRQSFFDPLDGSKLVSESRRDHGQFGSYPVHDDYNDESSP